MDINTATEQAYRNGYEAGKRDAEPKWIPVTERLPESGQEVIRYHGLTWNPKITLAFYYNGDEKRYGWRDVTHWMPIVLKPPTE